MIQVSSQYLFEVEISDSSIGLQASPHLPHYGLSQDEMRVAAIRYIIVDRARAALEETVVGAYDLWFRESGQPVVSFEQEIDATMFRLALDTEVTE